MANTIKINEEKVVDSLNLKIEKLEKENIEMNTKVVELDIELDKLRYRITELEAIVETTRHDLAETLDTLRDFVKFED